MKKGILFLTKSIRPNYLYDNGLLKKLRYFRFSSLKTIMVFFILSLVTSSCDKTLVDSGISDDKKIENSGQFQNYRIRMNDKYSVSVTAEFYSDKLINIKYDVVKQSPRDNYAILNFTNDESERSQVLVINNN